MSSFNPSVNFDEHCFCGLVELVDGLTREDLSLFDNGPCLSDPGKGGLCDVDELTLHTVLHIGRILTLKEQHSKEESEHRGRDADAKIAHNIRDPAIISHGETVKRNAKGADGEYESQVVEIVRGAIIATQAKSGPNTRRQRRRSR